MLKQIIVANTIANEMLVELSDVEQEASNGGLLMLPSDDSLTMPEMPAFPVISIDIYEPPNVSCPACSSGLNPHGGVTTLPAEVTPY
jgi:hypothetical protein